MGWICTALQKTWEEDPPRTFRVILQGGDWFNHQLVPSKASAHGPVCIAGGSLLDAAQQLLSQRAEPSRHLAVGDQGRHAVVFLVIEVSRMFLERGRMMLRGFKASKTHLAK